MANKELAGELIMRLFHSRTSAHVHHLQTKSYAQHVALGEYYEAIVGLADSFAEKIQGVHGLLPYPQLGYVKSPDFEPELKALRVWINENRNAVTADRELQNVIDEILGQVDATLYKLRFLQ